MKNAFITTIGLFLCLVFSHTAWGESQGSDYKGVTDPFGDPSNYEFAEDEKDDKEFFHLGRYLHMGFDIGPAFFTGGLGRTNTAGVQFGGRLIYFFDKSFGMEAGFHYAQHTDTIIAKDGINSAIIDTTLMPITMAFRYYFDVKNAPKAIAVANPYLVAGAGMYIRGQTVSDRTADFQFKEPNSSTNSFGVLGGAGVEFNVYKKHIYMGADLRYHMIFFPDEDQTFNNRVEEGDRGGDYFSAVLTITYNF